MCQDGNLPAGAVKAWPILCLGILIWSPGFSQADFKEILERIPLCRGLEKALWRGLISKPGEFDEQKIAVVIVKYEDGTVVPVCKLLARQGVMALPPETPKDTILSQFQP